MRTAIREVPNPPPNLFFLEKKKKYPGAKLQKPPDQRNTRHVAKYETINPFQ